MRHCLCFISLLLAVTAARPLPNMGNFLGPGEGDGELWAVLIAGSAGWGNYRHQADVCHATQVLLKGGVPADRLIVMMYDDIAQNPDNPRPGKIINHPKGEDVYAGVPLDYTGEAVNANNFLAVLSGNKTSLTPPSRGNGKFSGRVVEAGPNDRLFVFFSDHGAPGILGMPSGPFLYADQLHYALRNRTAIQGFKEAVLYIEACESGSIFDGLLERDTGIYAVTAANGKESSWGTYCPGMDGEQPPPGFNTCLGDLFSVSWTEDADRTDLTQETLKKQFQKVRHRTSSNWTYSQGSHVMHFGQISIDEEPSSDFEGQLNRGVSSSPNSNTIFAVMPDVEKYVSVPQREADLVPLRGEALLAEIARRQSVDDAVAGAVEVLLAEHSVSNPFLSLAVGEGKCIMTEAVGREEGQPLVDDWDCLRNMVAAWEESCGPLDQYGMKNTRTFANLCNAGIGPHGLRTAAQQTCRAPPVAVS